MRVALHRCETGGDWSEVATGRTDDDGRISNLSPEGEGIQPGDYRLTFATGAYFESQGKQSFYPRVEVFFTISDADQHYHVPLLLSPFGYSTYRGS